MSIQKSELTELQILWAMINVEPQIKMYNKDYGDVFMDFTFNGKRYRIGITEVKTKIKNKNDKKNSNKKL